MSTVDDAVAAIRAGQPVVLPFDTVYGLAADPFAESASRRLYELKGRAAKQPTALVARDLDLLFECLPELCDRATSQLRKLLPAPYTLVVPNFGRRFPWLTGSNPAAIGIRVPDLIGATADVLAAVGAVVATSANRPGEADPAALGDVPDVIRAAAGAAVNGGKLPGTPSTVVDLTGEEPRVLREGAVSASETLRRLGAAVRST